MDALLHANAFFNSDFSLLNENTCAKYELLNAMRSNRVRQQYADSYAAHTARFLYDNSNVEYQNLRDIQATIEESIARLPQKQETVFRLSRIENLSIDEIAQRMNLSKHTVENYITAALKTLRASLGEFIMLVLLLVSR